MAFMTAGDVKVSPDLTAVLGGIGIPQKNNINDLYSKARASFAADRGVRGIVGNGPNDYAGNRFGAGENLSQLGLTGGLENVLGNSAYADAKAQRDFQQNYALAKRSGELMKPSTLEEVLGGLGGVAQPAGQGVGLYNALKTPSVRSSAPDFGTATNPYGSFDMNSFRGYQPYDYSSYWR